MSATHTHTHCLWHADTLSRCGRCSAWCDNCNQSHLRHRNLCALFIIHSDVSLIHSVQIDGSTGCCHLNPYMQIPITIGSYPILDEPQLYGYPTAIPATSVITQQPSAPASAPSVGTASKATTSNGSERPSAPFPENGKFLSYTFDLFCQKSQLIDD